MGLLLQQLFLVAADLVFASALSCLFYALGCLVVTGLVGYVVVLSCGARAVKKAKRNVSQVKGALLRRVSKNRAGQTAGEILGLAGWKGTALRPSEEAPGPQEEGSAGFPAKGLPAGEKKGQRAAETLTGGRLSRTGTSCEMKMRPGMIWVEERETSQADDSKAPVNQKKVSMIPAFLLSLLFAPSDWCLKKRHFQRLAALLTPLKKSRD